MCLQVKFEEIYDRLEVIEYLLFFIRILGLCVCIQFIIGLSYIVRETSKHMVETGDTSTQNDSTWLMM